MLEPSSGPEVEEQETGTNRRRAGHALGASLLCLGLFAVAEVVFLFSAMWGRRDPIFGGSLSPAGPLDHLGMSAAAPIAALRAALSSRALGAIWKRALIGAASIMLVFS